MLLGYNYGVWFFGVWAVGIPLIPTLYYRIGGLMGKTTDELRRNADGFSVGSLLFWPFIPPIFILMGALWCCVDLITYPARRNQKLKDRAEKVSGVIYTLRWKWREHEAHRTLYDKPSIPFPEVEMLNKMPWRDAEAYLKKKGEL